MSRHSASPRCWSRLIFEKIVELNRTRGLTILLVEQNANLALEVLRATATCWRPAGCMLVG
jgi:ABC-type branched-subunit amino acid transport system ATPase component